MEYQVFLPVRRTKRGKLLWFRRIMELPEILKKGLNIHVSTADSTLGEMPRYCSPINEIFIQDNGEVIVELETLTFRELPATVRLVRAILKVPKGRGPHPNRWRPWCHHGFFTRTVVKN